MYSNTVTVHVNVLNVCRLPTYCSERQLAAPARAATHDRQALLALLPIFMTMAVETTDSTGADSMAARLARQRQQRSMLRTSNLPLIEDGENRAPSSIGSEVQILRAEVAESGNTVAKLQTQLRQSEAEILEIGQNTSRMEAELRRMQDQVTQVQAPAQAPRADHEEPPMEVKIDLGADGDVSVEVSVMD